MRRGSAETECLVVPEAERLVVPEAECLVVPEAECLVVPETECLVVPEAECVVVPQAECLAVPQAECLAVQEAKLFCHETVPEQRYRTFDKWVLREISLRIFGLFGNFTRSARASNSYEKKQNQLSFDECSYRKI